MKRRKTIPRQSRFVTVLTCAEIRKMSGLSQRNFADCYGIPYSSIVNWERGTRNAPEYLMLMLERIVREDTGESLEETRKKYPYISLAHFPKKKQNAETKKKPGG